MKKDAGYKKPVIMAPAGDWITIKAAIDARADAVYFGIKGLNMRACARNFSVLSLKRITGLCHDVGGKAYLTLNTVIYEGELRLMRTILLRSLQQAAGNALA